MGKGIPKVAEVKEVKVVAPLFFFDEGYMGIIKDGVRTMSRFNMKDSNERTNLLETINNLIK